MTNPRDEDIVMIGGCECRLLLVNRDLVNNRDLELWFFCISYQHTNQMAERIVGNEDVKQGRRDAILYQTMSFLWKMKCPLYYSRNVKGAFLARRDEDLLPFPRPLPP